MKPILRILFSSAIIFSFFQSAGTALADPAQPPVNTRPLSVFNQQPLSPQSPNTVEYYNGAIQYSTIINCSSIIQGMPYSEYGVGAYVGFAADPVAALPGPGQVYYLHVVVAGLGNACSGQREWIEIALPASTGLAPSAGNPIRCYYDGAPLSSAECPQTLPASSLHPGAYWIPSADTANARTWPMPQGHFLEIQVPVMSSVVLTNANMTAYVKSLDGDSSPWLQPSVGVYVFSNTLTILYPGPSTERITSPTPGYKSSAYVYSHYQPGNAYFDLGTTAAYGEFTDLPAPITSDFPAFTVWSDWTPHTLLPNTLYHWRVRFVPTVGSPVMGADQTFITDPDGQVKVGSGVSADCTQTAFDSALATPGVKRVIFDCGASPLAINLSGQKTITSSLTIDGGNKVTLQGNNTFRLFDALGGTLTLNNLSLIGGAVSGCGGAIHVANGAILSANYLRLNNNHAVGSGGGLCVDSGGGIVINNTQISGNSASGDGGGIYNAGSVDAMWSDVSGNTAGGNGGGAFNSGGMGFSTSLISGNSVPTEQARSGAPTLGAGGGIFNTGSLDLYTSSIANNTGSYAGGVFNSSGTITITNVTISGNSVYPGLKPFGANAQSAGIESFSGTTSLRNTLIANNLVPGLLGGMVENNCGSGTGKTITSLGNDLDSGSRCFTPQVSDLQNVDPQLGLLGNNGGKTRTIALSSQSPALDRADNIYCGMFDQRGFSGPSGPGGILQRQVNGTGKPCAICDIGAFEYHPTLYIPLLMK